MIDSKVKAIYDNGLVTLSFIKGMIVADVLIVLFIALMNSRLIDIVNSTAFWGLVIAYFAYRNHFRGKIGALVGLEDWNTIENAFKEQT